MKSSLEGFTGIYDQVKERIDELEDRMKEITDAEEQKAKRLKKSRQNLRELWDTMMWTTKHISGVSEGEERALRAERILEEIMPKTSLV